MAEVIKVCIRETQPRLLRDLKFVLEQQELNRPELESVRRLFVEQFPSKERNGNDVLKFYGWIEQHHPDLLTRGQGDPYQTLKVDLSGLYKD